MGGIALPEDSFLKDLEVVMVAGGRKVWTTPDRDRYYTWDTLHGEVEVFNKRGKHLGAARPVTGELYKPADRRKSLDV